MFKNRIFNRKKNDPVEQQLRELSHFCNHSSRDTNVHRIGEIFFSFKKNYKESDELITKIQKAIFDAIHEFSSGPFLDVIVLRSSLESIEKAYENQTINRNTIIKFLQNLIEEIDRIIRPIRHNYQIYNILPFRRNISSALKKFEESLPPFSSVARSFYTLYEEQRGCISKSLVTMKLMFSISKEIERTLTKMNKVKDTDDLIFLQYYEQDFFCSIDKILTEFDLAYNSTEIIDYERPYFTMRDLVSNLDVDKHFSTNFYILCIHIIGLFVEKHPIFDSNLKRIAAYYLENFSNNSDDRELDQKVVKKIGKVISDCIVSFTLYDENYFEECSLIERLKEITFLEENTSIKDFLHKSIDVKVVDPLCYKDYFYRVSQYNEELSNLTAFNKDFNRFSLETILSGQLLKLKLNGLTNHQDYYEIVKNSLFSDIQPENKKNELVRLFCMHTNQAALSDLSRSWFRFYLSSSDITGSESIRISDDAGARYTSFYPIKNGYGVVGKNLLVHMDLDLNAPLFVLGTVSMVYELTLDEQNPDLDRVTIRCVGLECERDQASNQKTNPSFNRLVEKIQDKAALIFPWQRIDVAISFFAYGLAIDATENPFGYELQKIAKDFCTAVRENYSSPNPDTTSVNQMNRIAKSIKQAYEENQDLSLIENLTDTLQTFRKSLLTGQRLHRISHLCNDLLAEERAIYKICDCFFSLKTNDKDDQWIIAIEKAVSTSIHELSSKPFLDAIMLEHSLDSILQAYKSQHKRDNENTILDFLEKIIPYAKWYTKTTINKYGLEYIKNCQERILLLIEHYSDSQPFLYAVAQGFCHLCKNSEKEISGSFLMMSFMLSIGNEIKKILNKVTEHSDSHYPFSFDYYLLELFFLLDKVLDKFQPAYEAIENAEYRELYVKIRQYLGYANDELYQKRLNIIESFSKEHPIFDSNLKRIATHFLENFSNVSDDSELDPEIIKEIAKVISHCITRFTINDKSYFEEYSLIDALKKISDSSEKESMLKIFLDNSIYVQVADPLYYKDYFYGEYRYNKELSDLTAFELDFQRNALDFIMSGQLLVSKFKEVSNSEEYCKIVKDNLFCDIQSEGMQNALIRLFCMHTNQAAVSDLVRAWPWLYLTASGNLIQISNRLDCWYIFFYPIKNGYGIVEKKSLSHLDSIERSSRFLGTISMVYELTLDEQNPNPDEVTIRCIGLECKGDKPHNDRRISQSFDRFSDIIQTKAGLIFPWQRMDVEISFFAYNRTIDAMEDPFGHELQKIAKDFCTVVRENYSSANPNITKVTEMNVLSESIKQAIDVCKNQDDSDLIQKLQGELQAFKEVLFPPSMSSSSNLFSSLSVRETDELSAESGVLWGKV